MPVPGAPLWRLAASRPSSCAGLSVCRSRAVRRMRTLSREATVGSLFGPLSASIEPRGPTVNSVHASHESLEACNAERKGLTLSNGSEDGRNRASSMLQRFWSTSLTTSRSHANDLVHQQNEISLQACLRGTSIRKQANFIRDWRCRFLRLKDDTDSVPICFYLEYWANEADADSGKPPRQTLALTRSCFIKQENTKTFSISASKQSQPWHIKVMREHELASWLTGLKYAQILLGT